MVAMRKQQAKKGCEEKAEIKLSIKKYAIKKAKRNRLGF